MRPCDETSVFDLDALLNGCASKPRYVYAVSTRNLSTNMMLTTHALVGALLALPVAVVAPGYAPAAVVAGFVGGSFPDLDVLARHRRTLHFPRYYGYVALPAAFLALAYPTTATVTATLFFVGAWAHSLMDVVGGSPEPRPWEAKMERAVYDHHAKRWLPPLRWIRYDGAPEDFALVLVVAVPVTYLAPDGFVYVVAAVLVISAAYTVLRKRIGLLAEDAEATPFVED